MVYVYEISIMSSKTYEKVHKLLKPSLHITRFGFDGIVICIAIILSDFGVINYIIAFLIIGSYILIRKKLFEVIYHHGMFIRKNPF